MVSLACIEEIEQQMRLATGRRDHEHVAQRFLLSTPHKFSAYRPIGHLKFQDHYDVRQAFPNRRFSEVRSTVKQGSNIVEATDRHPHNALAIFRPQDNRDQIWNYVLRCSSLQDAVSRSSLYFAGSHEHLFYKIVTPSDVGKLNRLVIPKQHAERCFPLDPSLRKRGLLLSFRDHATGKSWWFRYSYWSSSQSYVLTKGWIRFVKEKKLQAGDIISFERGSQEEFYINCRRKPVLNPIVCEGVQSTPIDSLTDSASDAQPSLSACSHRRSDRLQLLLPSGECSSSPSKTVTDEAAAEDSSDLSKLKIKNQTSNAADYFGRTADPLNSISNMRLFGVDLSLSTGTSNVTWTTITNRDCFFSTKTDI
ncbi:hypothetical protein O6H91_09G097300 [Diphasiastrum complanatum]|uniref:Uncharacterized protein n=1 Tax=Diphasiastrum complanatum TaxID=34168 RepID=A0ACC2CSK9_DIPCM|nr:hypothetical protein O6H91_09G097300 [Diphasiastrum complanatum]